MWTDRPHDRRRAAAPWVALTLVVAPLLGPAPVASQQERRAASLQNAPAVAALYERILHGEFRAVAADLATCAGVSREACDVLDATRIWWRILLDPDSTALDAEFERAVERAIASTEAWTRREPARAEAWFYLGGAYGARVQWRVLREERLAAARDGKRIKEALEQALELDPSLEDANFGIGLYQYYADVAPTAAKILRVLLLLPGGDREEGLARMLRARERGQVLRGEADYQLHVIDLWYEEEFPRALGLLQGLERRHPRNPLFTRLIAEVQEVYFHDRIASLAAYRHLVDGGAKGTLHEPALAEVAGRLGAARQLDTLYESDAAIDLLQPVITARPRAPYGATAEAYLHSGRALARLGRRDEATRALRAAQANAPAGDPDKLRDQAREAMRARVDPAAARAYATSLEGWRAFERRDTAAALRLLTEALAAREHGVARYRLAHVRRATGDAAGALADYERVLSARYDDFPTFYASACVEAAGLLERRGERARALQLYERAATVFGAAQSTRSDASRQAARLRGASGAR